MGDLGLGDAFAGVLAQGMSHFVRHDDGDFVIRQLELIDDSRVENNLATGHAEGVELFRRDQVDLPAPAGGAGIEAHRVWEDVAGNRADALELGVVRWRQGALVGRFAHHLTVLDGGRALQFFGRYQTAHHGGVTDLDTILAGLRRCEGGHKRQGDKAEDSWQGHHERLGIA